MSQNYVTNTPPGSTSGPTLATQIDARSDALLTMHSGAARPSYAKAGTCWLKDDASPWVLNFYDGAQDVLLATVDPTTHAITWNLAANIGSDVQAYSAALASIAALTPTEGAQLVYSGGAWGLGDGIPAGVMTEFAAAAPPAGWLECNGAALSRTTYAALFAAIGTTFGAGDGSATFNIPDMRGVFSRGWDHGRGLDSGRAFGSYQADAFQSHSHGTDSFRTGAGGTTFGSGPGTMGFGSGTYASGGTETRPKNVALLYMIKY